MELRDRVAVITGGASGIGLATARALSESGCRLVIADIEEAALGGVVAELAASTEVLGVPTDVADRAAVDHLAELTDERFGGADIVFLNAGVGTSGPILKVTHDDWRWVIGVNLWGPIHGVEAFLPRLVASEGESHLLFTSSFAGLVPNVGAGPYCVTKYGVVALAEVLYRELRGTGVRVSVVCPMLVDTNVGRAHRNRPQELGGPGTEDLNATADPNLVGRVLPPEVVAATVRDAIGTDRLYVLTHAESRPMIARRFARIDAAFD
jgi:NAD(P)-dependent dehydrogenase (short-subunit alcohol dehydrogenase family)